MPWHRKVINIHAINYTVYIQFLVFHQEMVLTHWGRVTHKYIGNLTIIGSDIGLWPGRCQAIIWTNDGILLIGPFETNFSETLIKIHAFSFKKTHLKMAEKCWPFWLRINVLNIRAISVMRNDKNCKSISMFPKINSTWLKLEKNQGWIRICLDFTDPYDPIWLIHLISMLIGWDRVFAFPPSSITAELIGWEPSIQDKPVQAYLNADWLILQCHFLCPACISLNLSFP